MHSKLKTHNNMTMFFPKNLIPWRDSNPGLLSLRLMRHAARLAQIFSPIGREQADNIVSYLEEAG
jgi:hypothetical protein